MTQQEIRARSIRAPNWDIIDKKILSLSESHRWDNCVVGGLPLLECPAEVRVGLRTSHRHRNHLLEYAHYQLLCSNWLQHLMTLNGDFYHLIGTAAQGCGHSLGIVKTIKITETEEEIKIISKLLLCSAPFIRRSHFPVRSPGSTTSSASQSTAQRTSAMRLSCRLFLKAAYFLLLRESVSPPCYFQRR